MPYSIHHTSSCIAVEFWGAVDFDDLITARLKAAQANPERRIERFLLDFDRVDEFDLTLQARDAIRAVNDERAETLRSGRCAIVAPRETIELGTDLLIRTSGLGLDFETFQSRAAAERWLTGETGTTERRANDG